MNPIEINQSPLYKIPTFTAATQTWGYIEFQTRGDFKQFLLPLFKEPGKYNFDETSRMFNEQGRRWRQNKYYCAHNDNTRDFRKYWDEEKEKCRQGVFFIGETETWYISRDYYMWLNFLPIYNKEIGDFKFPDIYDGQYHVALYEMLAELHYKHSVILKKRQFAMSYFHAAKLINLYWFEKGATLKLLASDDAYINEKGTWAFLNEYRDFLNEHTAWYRHNEPDSVGKWQQRIQIEINGRKTMKGNKSRLLSISTQQSATKGVGGPAKLVVYEESGIAPTMDKSFGYMKSALQLGPLVTVGMFIAYGSVGDLKQCEPLKKFMYKPEENGFYGVATNLVDSKGTIKIMGLFIPEQWSMLPYMDEFGNSKVEEAVAALKELRIQQKKELSPEDYQLEVSQHPMTIEEAFAWREEAIFPQEHVTQMLQMIDDGAFPHQFIELNEDEKKNIISSLSHKIPITDFPIDKKMVNKEGVIICYERPDPKAAWGTYIASIDPVAEGKTVTSDSLCSIIVYKTAVEVIKHLEDGTIKSHIEGDKIVCTWTGRFDDIKKTHKRLEYIIRWYNAWTLCEANVSLFINHMIAVNLQHYMVPKDQILFLKELTGNNGYHDYGWKNTGTMFKTNLLSYGIEFIKEELFVETAVDGSIIKITYGGIRIPDRMIWVEMKEYRYGLNVDRLVAYCALIAFIKIQYASRGYVKKIEYAKKLENSQNFGKLNSSPFKHLGGGNQNKIPVLYRVKRSAFKNYR